MAYPVAFAKALLAEDHDIIAVKYFTSRVNYNPREASKKEHQEIYLRALSHWPKVQIIEGFYKSRDAKLPFRKGYSAGSDPRVLRQTLPMLKKEALA